MLFLFSRKPSVINVSKKPQFENLASKSQIDNSAAWLSDAYLL